MSEITRMNYLLERRICFRHVSSAHPVLCRCDTIRPFAIVSYSYFYGTQQAILFSKHELLNNLNTRNGIVIYLFKLHKVLLSVRILFSIGHRLYYFRAIRTFVWRSDTKMCRPLCFGVPILYLG